MGLSNCFDTSEAKTFRCLVQYLSASLDSVHRNDRGLQFNFFNHCGEGLASCSILIIFCHVNVIYPVTYLYLYQLIRVTIKMVLNALHDRVHDPLHHLAIQSAHRLGVVGIPFSP